jgi:hypothetical protein
MGTVKLARVTSQLCCGDVDDVLSGEVMASYCLLPYEVQPHRHYERALANFFYRLVTASLSAVVLQDGSRRWPLD